MQTSKGKSIALKASQKAKLNQLSMVLSSVSKLEVEDSDDKFSYKEDKLILLTRRVQRMLRKRKGSNKFFSKRGYQQGESSKYQVKWFECNMSGI